MVCVSIRILIHDGDYLMPDVTSVGIAYALLGVTVVSTLAASPEHGPDGCCGIGERQ